MSHDLNTFLEGPQENFDVRTAKRVDFRPALLGLLEAGTRALNAYAANAGKPTLTYIVRNTLEGLNAQGTETRFFDTLKDLEGHAGTE